MREKKYRAKRERKESRVTEKRKLSTGEGGRKECMRKKKGMEEMFMKHQLSQSDDVGGTGDERMPRKGQK